MSDPKSSSGDVVASATSGAELLECSDDLLQRVISLLPLEASLRLQTVSKRWQRFVLVDLHFPVTQAWRAPRVVACSRAYVRRLDVSSLKGSAESSYAFAALVRALSSGAAAASQLQSIVMWTESSDFENYRAFDRSTSLSEAQTLQLAAACPRLDASTRLALHAEGAVQALRLLDAVPGRHALFHRPIAILRIAPLGDDDDVSPIQAAERAAIPAFVRHPRLAALHHKFDLTHVPGIPRRWFSDALFEALTEALRGRESSLAYLSIDDSVYRDERAQLLSDPAAWEAALAEEEAAAAAAAGPDLTSPTAATTTSSAAARESPKESPLRAFHMSNRYPVSFARAVLAACGRGLRHLTLDWEDENGHHSVAAAASLTAILAHLSSSLETLDFFCGQCGESALPAVAALLATSGCRVRRLGASYVRWGDGAVADADGGDAAGGQAADRPRTELAAICDGITANKSLESLSIGAAGGPDVDRSFTSLEGGALAAALAERAAGCWPLRTLELCHVHPSVAGVTSMIVSSGVRELTITRIDGDGDCKLLSAAIPACRALASLAIGTRSVRAKPISETGTRLVLEGIIAASPTLRRFQWCNAVDRFDEVTPPPVWGCLRTVGRVVREKASVTVLDLGGVCCSQQGLPPSLAAALAENKTLRFFSVANASGADVAGLVAGLGGNTTLRTLCFLNPDMRGEGTTALLAARLAAAARTCGLRHVAFLFSPDWLHWSEEKELERRDALALCAAALPAAPRLALHFGVTDWSYSVSEHGGNSKLAALLDRMLPGRLRARVRVADGGPLYSELAAAAAACGLLAGEQQQQQPVADA